MAWFDRFGPEVPDVPIPSRPPRRAVHRPQLERMWARHRIDELERRLRTGEGGARDEIVRLGEAFQIVTEYTSFLVLESDAEYQRWKIERRNALRSVRDRKALEALRREAESLLADGGLGPVDPSTEPGAVRQPPSSGPVSRPAPSRPGDLVVPARRRSGGGGGGAIDPIGAGGVAFLVVLAMAACRRGD